MSKIILIEPKSPNLHIFTQFHLPRLGIFILGTIMLRKGWEVEIMVEENCNIDYEGIRLADLVGISTITSTAPRAYAIADKIRGMSVPVVMGGPHVTYLPEEALDHADYVIRGEGEKALNNLADTLKDGGSLSTVPNLSYYEGDSIRHNQMLPFECKMDEIPYPDFELLKDHTMRLGNRTIIPVQTSRGCPFDCSFCSVTGMFGKKYRFRSTENIIEELRQYNSRKNFIFFYDDNFTANRRHAKELLKGMIAEKFRFKWSTQVRVDIARDPELVRLMKKAGCHTLFIGMESVNPESLKAMKKKQTLEDMALAVKSLRRQRIHIHGMFVYGFDQDDWQTVKQTVKFAKRAQLTSTQFLILTPLPGSEFYNRISAEKRIRLKDWSLYDAHHAVFQPTRLTIQDLQKAQIFSHQKFYSWVEMVKKFIQGKWIDLGLAHYARNLNRLWKKKNRTYLKVIELLTPKRGARIELDYREEVILDDEAAQAV